MAHFLCLNDRCRCSSPNCCILVYFHSFPDVTRMMMSAITQASCVMTSAGLVSVNQVVGSYRFKAKLMKSSPIHMLIRSNMLTKPNMGPVFGPSGRTSQSGPGIITLLLGIRAISLLGKERKAKASSLKNQSFVGFWAPFLRGERLKCASLLYVSLVQVERHRIKEVQGLVLVRTTGNKREERKPTYTITIGSS